MTHEFEADDGADVPMALVAVTVNVYGVPGVKSKTVNVIGEPKPIRVAPPGLAVAV